MLFFPMFCDVKGKYILIVGGGKRAYQKAERLLPYGGDIHVVYPEISEEIKLLEGISKEERLIGVRDFSPEPFFVVAACETDGENKMTAEMCRSRRIPVNAVDLPEYCDFVFPALIERGALSVGISTGGACPAVTTALKQQIEALLPEKTEDILYHLEQILPKLRGQIDDEAVRGDIIRRMFSESAAKNRVLTESEEKEIIADMARI